MHWEWIVPVIALALWILSSLVRNTEEPPRVRSRPPAGGGPPQQAGKEVDRFMEEINRMRRQGSQPRQAAPPSEEPLDVIPVERETAPSFERPKPPPAVAEAPRRKVRVQAARPVVPKVTVLQPTTAIPEAVPVPPPPPSSARPGARPSPAVAQLRTLLQTPATLQTAVLLQEVLGPPRCRRRH